MVLDHAGLQPNPVRDRSIKLPREEPEEINPPSAERRRDRLPDRAGQASARAAVARLVGRPRLERRPDPGRRLRRAPPARPAALGDDEDPARRSGSSCARLDEQIRASLPPREDRDLDARLFASSGADALRTSIAKACKATGIALWSPHDLRHRRIIAAAFAGCSRGRGSPSSSASATSP